MFTPYLSQKTKFVNLFRNLKPLHFIQLVKFSSFSSSEFAFELHGVTKKHGTKYIFENLSMTALKGIRLGVLGTNGSGKSSLLKIIAGLDREFEGEIKRSPNLKFNYLAQEPFIDHTKNVQANIEMGIKFQKDLLDQFENISMAMGEPDCDIESLSEEQGKILSQIEAFDAWNLDSKVQIAMSKLNLPPPDSPTDKLSGGERRRLALCKILLEAPDVLLLDEPTNHLDTEAVSWLEKYLASYKGTVIMVTHDRSFLDNVSSWILEIDRGKIFTFQGNYSTYLEKRIERLEQESTREVKIARLARKELDWICQRKGTKFTSQEKKKLEKEKTNQSHRYERSSIIIPNGPSLTSKVIDTKNISKKFDGRWLIKNFTFSLGAGEKVGIVGPNGTGKTTFFRMLAGELEPDEGTVTLGEKVRMGVVTQFRSSFDESLKVYEEISQGRNFIELLDQKAQINVRTYVAAFNFQGTAQEKMISSLSGGERNRVHLAKVLLASNNVLLLDEPTNDLDVDTLRALEEALKEYAGSAIIISHDRWFLERLCTRILKFSGDGKVKVCNKHDD